MNAIALSSRERWHSYVSDLAALDCCLTDLLPWPERGNLGRLPPEKFEVLTRELSCLVDWACESQRGGTPTQEIECALAKRVWNFVKPLNPNLPPFGEY